MFKKKKNGEQKGRSVISKIFMKPVKVKGDGGKEFEANPISIISILIVLGVIGICLLSGWQCGGCQKKPLDIKEIRGMKK